MSYISLNDLVADIRSNFYKIQQLSVSQQFIGIIGIPRSGLIPASILAQYLNIGFCSLNEFIVNSDLAFQFHGSRLLNSYNNQKPRILVVDDTCFNGNSLFNAKKQLLRFYPKFDFVFMSVYLEGKCSTYTPDLWLRDVRQLADFKQGLNIVLYEWNIMHHYYQENILYDLDGVILQEPPDERKTKQYEDYIKNPLPLFIPSTSKRISICTYRLSKYRQITLDSLTKFNVIDPEIKMFEGSSINDRIIPAYIFKSIAYNDDFSKLLFIESEDFQARKINEITKKPVYCVSTNKYYK